VKRFVTILVIFQYKRYKQEISFKGIEPKPAFTFRHLQRTNRGS